MLKLTGLYRGENIFVDPKKIKYVHKNHYAYTTEDGESKEAVGTLISFGTDENITVREDVEDIVRYLVSKRSYNSNDKYDTVENIVLEKDDDDYDNVIDALGFAQAYLRKKINEHKEKGSNLYQDPHYEESLKKYEELQSTIVSVSVRKVE